MKLSRYILCLVVVLLAGLPLQAQVPTGTPPWGSFGGGPFDVVNLGNLNSHFSIAVRHKAGRVTPFTYNIGYDTSVWYPVGVSGSQTWQPTGAYGWTIPTASTGSLTSQVITTNPNWIPCNPPNDLSQVTFVVNTFVYTDSLGGTHPFGSAATVYSRDHVSCPYAPAPSTSTIQATDGSGYSLIIANQTTSYTAKVTGPDGKIYWDQTLTGTTSDANGNQITTDGSGNITDTLGTTVLSITGTFPKYLKYTAPNGSLATWTLNYTSYNLKTNFGCSGIAEYNATGVPFPTSLSLPDGTSYTFTYEDTQGFSGYKTGRLASVTLPTGGSISYSYPLNGTHNGINCADGSAPASVGGAASMTRTVSPGGTWNYYRTQVSGKHWQTKVTSPLDPTVGNDTVIDFQQDSSSSQYGNTHNYFEVQRKTYQGSSTAGTLLSTGITCYNTASPVPANCPTTSVSTLISRVTSFSYLPDTSSGSKVAETDTQYSFISSPAFPSEVDSYDYGTGGVGSLVRKVINGWQTWGNTVVLNSTVVKDASNNIKASTSFVHDAGTPTATTAPQHTTTGISNSSRGNLTQVSQQVSGSVTLYRNFTYYDTGMVNTATDWGTTTSGGPNTTTYNYSSGGSCGYSFVTSLSEPLTLSQSFTWNCTGGVQTSSTDENSQTSTTYYAQTSSYGSPDANYWRPYASTDPLSNATKTTYPSNTVAETTLLFNSSHSVVDQRGKLDQFGRPILSQMEEGPSLGTYDSTQVDYDPLGRVSKTYLPFTNATDAPCSGTCPGTTTSYDALYRALTVQDGGTGTVTYTYTKNDVLQSIGAPSGENSKRRQMEYDGLGRLASVCEVTSASGSGSCGQTNGQTGFWTKYTYDLLGNRIGVIQNAQAASASQQTRTYAFDMLGRLTSETNPETGTTAISYVYDSLSADASCGTVTSAGDLVKKTDAMGNVTCYSYDGLHRVTATTYPTGTYAAATDQKHFVYDSATVNSVAMANAKGRLAEAYTCGSSCSTHKTDEGFSYSARGEVADVWQQTPDSAGWHHVNATYWAHGRLNVLNGGTSPLPGLPTITFGASDGSGMDSKGRITKVTAASGQNPVNSINWNPGNQITGVTFGSLDNDSYQYDSSTGRMTQYQLNMGAGPQSQTGTLTWNANGTLSKLQITDQVNSGNTQTCKYGDPSSSVPGYDDMGRLIKADCASAWSQTFSFDPFGNLSKTGSAQFLPTYTGTSGAGSPTNQYYQISGGAAGTTVYYDSNGNLKNDVTHSYTWDADGNMLSTDGTTVTMIYDAMDRMVEQTRGSSHTEIVYGPHRMKLALMNGQTLVQAFVKLPGGSRAVYSSSGLAYYRHSDHLGSSRLATTPSRTKYYDVAYAPYGEDYNGSGTTPDLSFTDEHQDTVTGGWATNLYDFMLREFRTAHGRWTKPDPAGLGSVDPTNPQTWNRYAYVANNPLTFTDSLGLNIDARCFSDSYSGGGCGGGGGGGCNPDVMNCMGGAGTGDSGSGGGMFGGGTGIDGVPWNFGPGYNMQTTSPLYQLQAGVSRYLSIMRTGWDPALRINWNDVNYLAQANGQYNRLSGNAADVFGSGYSVDPTTCNLSGGHCNFSFSCDSWDNCGPGRYDDGLHVECAGGGYNCTSGQLWIHDDTVSPWTGKFTAGALVTGNFWEHGFVDLIGGTFFVGAFPQ